jgi:hypothetical protein
MTTYLGVWLYLVMTTYQGVWLYLVMTTYLGVWLYLVMTTYPGVLLYLVMTTYPGVLLYLVMTTYPGVWLYLVMTTYPGVRLYLVMTTYPGVLLYLVMTTYPGVRPAVDIADCSAFPAEIVQCQSKHRTPRYKRKQAIKQTVKAYDYTLQIKRLNSPEYIIICKILLHFTTRKNVTIFLIAKSFFFMKMLPTT